jgi:GntR family transcriptional regulator, arabinose operon transcriptional repressor
MVVHSHWMTLQYSRLLRLGESCYNSFRVLVSQSAHPPPKYRRIFEQLTRDVLSGRYAPGDKFPSEAALVQRFGASRITVGRAVRELQQHGMVDRVAGSGTFVRDPSHRARKAPVFGLVIPNLGETEIFEPICRAIAAAPESQDHALLWPHADGGGHGDEALQLARQCVDRAVAGVFFAPLEMSAASAGINRRVMKMLKDAAIPVVLLDRRPEEMNTRDRCDLVGIDNQHAGYLATRHLLIRGAKRIGFAAYRGQAATVKARMHGYRAALAEARNREPRTVYLNPHGTAILPPDARACDAFVCANDRIAGRLMHTMLAEGVRIPQDVRLVGMDDVNYASLLPVPLTTIHQPCGDIGETALRMMLERLERPQMPARDVLLDCSLVVRESCGGKL